MTSKRKFYSAILLVLIFTLLHVSESAAQKSPVTLDYEGFFGTLPKSVSEPGPIVAITELADGRIALLESSDNRILIFSPKGDFLIETGGFGLGDGGLRSAGDIASVGFELWACDPLANRIVRYDSWMAPLDPFTADVQSSGDPLFDRPISVSRSVFGDLTLLEADLGEAVMLDAEGRLIERILTFGRTGQSLIQPRRVETSEKGTVAIADPGLHAVVLLDRFGNKQRVLGWKLPGSGPSGLCWAKESLWMSGEGGVQLVSEEGRTLASWQASQFGGPVADIVVVGDRALLTVGNRVQVWRIKRAD